MSGDDNARGATKSTEGGSMGIHSDTGDTRSFPTFYWILVSVVGGLLSLLALKVISISIPYVLRTGSLPSIEGSGLLEAALFFGVYRFFSIILTVIPSIILWRILILFLPVLNNSWKNMLISVSAVYAVIFTVLYIVFNRYENKAILAILLGGNIEMLCVLIAPRIIIKRLKPGIVLPA
jgi:hypothetical protein